MFLSYQWGKQTEVEYLFKLLTAMGYSCWMDIHEMGGGDSLFDAIYKGIYNCKVVVSHVTSKYALSANCRREVSLSDALNKPIIPLLLDDIPWPPQGPMSMVFTQLLYIDFKDNNKTPQQLWSGSQFDQLIAKINSHLGQSVNKGINRPISAKKSGTINPNVKETPSANTAVHVSNKSNVPNGNGTASQESNTKSVDNPNKPVARSCNII